MASPLVAVSDGNATGRGGPVRKQIQRRNAYRFSTELEEKLGPFGWSPVGLVMIVGVVFRDVLLEQGYPLDCMKRLPVFAGRFNDYKLVSFMIDDVPVSAQPVGPGQLALLSISIYPYHEKC
jgi:hypothetical protein